MTHMRISGRDFNTDADLRATEAPAILVPPNFAIAKLMETPRSCEESTIAEEKTGVEAKFALQLLT